MKLLIPESRFSIISLSTLVMLATSLLVFSTKLQWAVATSKLVLPVAWKSLMESVCNSTLADSSMVPTQLLLDPILAQCQMVGTTRPNPWRSSKVLLSSSKVDGSTDTQWMRCSLSNSKSVQVSQTPRSQRKLWQTLSQFQSLQVSPLPGKKVQLRQVMVTATLSELWPAKLFKRPKLKLSLLLVQTPMDSWLLFGNGNLRVQEILMLPWSLSMMATTSADMEIMLSYHHHALLANVLMHSAQLAKLLPGRNEMRPNLTPSLIVSQEFEIVNCLLN